MSGPPAPRGPRPRELGVRIGALEPGPAQRDHRRRRRARSATSRSGATSRRARDRAHRGHRDRARRRRALFREPVPAGAAVLNGAGEMTGFVAISEWGLLETPVYLTSTMAVGRIYDGAVAAAVAADPRVGDEEVVIPVVGECDDSWLSRQRDRAGRGGRRGPRGRGGARRGGRRGRGRRRHRACLLRLEGRDRHREPRRARSGATVGVLVLANFGSAPDLRVDGVPVGPALPDPEAGVRRAAGSCISRRRDRRAARPAQLERLARRAGLGLGRTGSVAHHGSGEIFLAFATAGRARARSSAVGVAGRRRARPAVRRRPSRRPRRPCSTRSGRRPT